MAEALTGPAPVIVLNGNLVRDEDTLVALKTPKNLLKAKPRGVYSTARTVGRTSIFSFQDHVARLAKVWGDLAGEQEAKKMRELLLPSLKIGMQEFIARFPSAEELRITLLANKLEPHHQEAAEDVEISAYFEQLHLLPGDAVVTAEVRGSSPRNRPEIKDSQWVRDRESYEKAMSPDANEVILPDAAGHLYEGLSSNFFAVVRGTGEADEAIQTAPSGTVLEGTIRAFVLAACQEHGVPVIDTPPSLGEISRWKGAFITSTSRLVLPLGKLRLCEQAGAPEHVFEVPLPKLIREVQGWVLEKLLANAERIV